MSLKITAQLKGSLEKVTEVSWRLRNRQIVENDVLPVADVVPHSALDTNNIVLTAQLQCIYNYRLVMFISDVQNSQMLKSREK